VIRGLDELLDLGTRFRPIYEQAQASLNSRPRGAGNDAFISPGTGRTTGPAPGLNIGQ